ncbi:MAG: metal-dependent transcriptional regulator, partial [Deltaproteobacteria bacterium]|nr:metal-dependent transcriptional regulator [Deltaproteobacteria bacterium]
YELVRDQKVARVRDIAQKRGVRAASVTPAMRRLAELGLIRYEKREYIDLTPLGQREAQRVFSRHEALRGFFERVLRMPAEAAVADACAMEHSLSPGGMDYLVRFIEFVHNCPEGSRFLELFHGCSVARHGPAACDGKECPLRDRPREPERRVVALASLGVGARVRVRRIAADGAMRDRLLAAGLLPDVVLEIVRRKAGGERVEVRLGGFELRLSGEEAHAVLVAPPEDDE